MRIVRIIRVLEYIGPEDWIDQTLSNSYVQDTRQFGPNKFVQQIAIGPKQEVPCITLTEPAVE